MKRVLVLTGEPNEIANDLHKLFGFKITKVSPCDVIESKALVPAIAVTYKASNRKYEKFLETRERYGF